MFAAIAKKFALQDGENGECSKKGREEVDYITGLLRPRSKASMFNVGSHISITFFAFCMCISNTSEFVFGGTVGPDSVAKKSRSIRNGLKGVN
jgi:hypothetical protein